MRNEKKYVSHIPTIIFENSLDQKEKQQRIITLMANMKARRGS